MNISIRFNSDPSVAYGDAPISDRDIGLRRLIWGCSGWAPSDELGRIRRTGRGDAVYQLMESMRDMGVSLSQLCGLGVLIWGFFDNSLYDDEWVLEAWSVVERAGGVDAVLTKLERMGVDRELLYVLRSFDVMAPSGTSLPLSVGMAKIGNWREEDWYAEVSMLMDDAKKAGDKGFGVRKELLLMVGKKLGFIAPEIGDSLAGILSGLSAKAVSVLERITDAEVVACEVIDKEEADNGKD